MSLNKEILGVEGLRYNAGGKQIINSVALSIEQGSFIGIIGPNGSGKSTLLKNIYKVLKPQAGAIRLMGEDLLAMSNRQMAQHLAVMVQEREAAFDFTVEEIVMMGRHARKGLLETDSPKDRAAIRRILSSVSLEALQDHPFSTLSGGEKQRVLIARALAQDTPCLILDEPTNHLDVKYQLQLMDLLHSLNRTVIAAIHDLNIAALYCDRLYALKDGQIIGQGSPQELLTEEFIRNVYEVEARVVRESDGEIYVLYQSALHSGFKSNAVS